MLDLFNAPVLPGLASKSDFVTATEKQALIAAIDASGLSPFRSQGWTGKRLRPPSDGPTISTPDACTKGIRS